jgi:hypothetical protein
VKAFERRVTRLLALADGFVHAHDVSVLTNGSRRFMLGVGVAFLATLIAACLGTPLAVHRAAEAFLHAIR